jgi:hypothetical protein
MRSSQRRHAEPVPVDSLGGGRVAGTEGALPPTGVSLVFELVGGILLIILADVLLVGGRCKSRRQPQASRIVLHASCQCLDANPPLCALRRR